MEFLTHEAFATLAKERSDHCVSFYMPVHRTGREVQQDPVRLRNMLKEAEKHLMDRGLRKPEAEALLEKVTALLDHKFFWTDQKDGLVIFVSSNTFAIFKLPVEFKEELFVGDHFHLMPLLPLLHSSKEFYVLAVSDKMVRLLHGSETTLHEFFADTFPGGHRAVVGEDAQEKTEQYHNVSSPGGRYGQAHGHGTKKDTREDELVEFLRNIDKGICTILKGQSAPLVFAGAEQLFGHFKGINSYVHLLDDFVEGSIDRISEPELHKKAWPLVQPLVEESLKEIVSRYVELGGTEKVSNDIGTILPSASAGKVEILIIAKGAEQPGIYDEARATFDIHDEKEEGDDNLLDLAAIHTLAHGGDVYALEVDMMPEGAVVAAVLRA